MKSSHLVVTVAALVLMVALLSVAPGLAQGGLGFDARPTPTPMVSALPDQSAGPASPDALPDLVVQRIQVSPPDPYVGRDATVYVTIANIGTADVDVGNNFFLDLYINPPTDQLRGIPGDYDWGIQGHWMEAGASVVLSKTLTDVFIDAVSYNLWAQIDTPDLPAPPRPTGWVLESNEDNNILGPKYVRARTHFAWVQKDHVDFYQNMASTLDVVPTFGTVGIITNTPALVLGGDSALALGIFDEPPTVATWGLRGSMTSNQMQDYNMINPDTRLNQELPEYQVFPAVAALENLVVAVWEDGRNGPTYGRDIFMRWSTDSGDTWKPEQIVNDVGINDQRHPAVAIAPNGMIVVAWQDRRGTSFDIYVQAFFHDGTGLYRCDANGDCSTECSGMCNFRVDTDANQLDQILPDIDVDDDSNFYLAWQDRRNGNDDIFAVRSYYTATCPTTRMTLSAALQDRGEANLSPDQSSLCWAYDARIDDDPSTTKQGSPSINALKGLKILEIKYKEVVVLPGEPPMIVVTEVISVPTTYVAVVWEDWREGDADIYFTYSVDNGETFAVDKRLNADKDDNSTNGVDQLTPDVSISNWMKRIVISKPTQFGDAVGEAEVPVSTMQIVWQDFRNSTDAAKNNNPDIYHTGITVEPDGDWPWPIVLTYEEEQQVNNNDERAWQEGPVWQGEPRVDATGSALTQADSQGWNAYIVWADGRNYGGEFDNTDIYMQFLSNIGDRTSFITGNNLILNDGAHLHDFNVATYSPYRRDMPPHARQRNPAVASTLLVAWPTIFDPALYDPYIYVMWDDDRRQDPFSDRDVYIARTNLMYGGNWDLFNNSYDPPGEGECYASGAFVSEIFDTGRSDATWYIADWHATTDLGTYLTLQTRIGNTRGEVMSSAWYPNQEFPYPDDPDGLSKGAPLLGYDAPGQHIVDAGGNYWPEARYIQYRVNFWARNVLEDGCELRTPFLFDVVLHYEHPLTVYLPIVLRNR